MRSTIILILCLFLQNVDAQKPLHIDDFAKYETLFSKKYTSNSNLIAYAKAFLGVPYEGATLEKGNDKQTVVYLQGLDCTTYVENVLAFWFCQQISEQEFVQNLTKLRYRDGLPKGYTSRLHYLTECIFDNEQKGFLKDITQELGGRPITKQLDFMTKHRNLYPALKSQANFEELQCIEKKLSGKTRYYIPKKELKKRLYQIQEGDIIAFATDIKGLDFVHLGFAVHCKNDKNLHLLHASSKVGKVVVSSQSLLEYVEGYKKVSGIVVLRVRKK